MTPTRYSYLVTILHSQKWQMSLPMISSTMYLPVASLKSCLRLKTGQVFMKATQRLPPGFSQKKCYEQICFFYLDFTFVSLMSCQEKKTEVQTLDDEKLARVMADLNVAEAATLGLSGYPKTAWSWCTTIRYLRFMEQVWKNTKKPADYGADLPHLKQIVDMAGDNLNGDK